MRPGYYELSLFVFCLDSVVGLKKGGGGVEILTWLISVLFFTSQKPAILNGVCGLFNYPLYIIHNVWEQDQKRGN